MYLKDDDAMTVWFEVVIIFENNVFFLKYHHNNLQILTIAWCLL